MNDHPSRPFAWRRWNNILHRDIGYLIVGMTLIYAVSGIAVNHVQDWNPSYRIVREQATIEPVAATERDAIVQEVRTKLRLEEEPDQVFRPDPESVRLFYEGKTVSVDLPSGSVVIEQTSSRPVLFEFNQLHLNAPKQVWTYVADVYAGALIIVALTGLFVLKGKNGLTGRGWWLTLIGFLVPLTYWLWYLYS